MNPAHARRGSLGQGCSCRSLSIFATVIAFTTVVAILLTFNVAWSPRREGGSTAARVVFASSTSAPPKHSGTDEVACDHTSRSDHMTERLLPQKGNVYSVMRAADASPRAFARVSIPQTIWQTARSHNDTPQLGIDLYNSWTKHHPGWDHYFLDDAEVHKFVEAQYNQSVADAFKELPLGVMRADAVRYMMLYHYGGVYADMDTECFKPAETWAPAGCHFAVALENTEHFCQWAFASVAGHPALASVLDLVVRRMLAGDFLDNEHFVHYVTGPAVFTEGILRYLQVDWEPGQLEEMQAAEHVQLRKRGVCVLTQEELSESLSNLYGSQRKDLQSKSWTSWTDEGAAFVGAQKDDEEEDEGKPKTEQSEPEKNDEPERNDEAERNDEPEKDDSKAASD